MQTPTALCAGITLNAARSGSFNPSANLRPFVASPMRQTNVHLRRRPVQKRSQHACAAVLQAFIRLLEEQPYEYCTSNRIADLAGVGIGTFYEYFSNKETVLAVWLKAHCDRLMRQFDELIARANHMDLSAALAAVVNGTFDLYTEDLRAWPQVALLANAVTSDKQSARSHQAFAQRWQQLLDKTIDDFDSSTTIPEEVGSICHQWMKSRVDTTLGLSPDLICSPQFRAETVSELGKVLQAAIQKWVPPVQEQPRPSHASSRL